MSVNSSNQPQKRNWRLAVALPLWVVIGFGVAQLLLVGVVFVAQQFGLSLVSVDGPLLQFSLAAIVYILTLLLVIGLPWWLRKHATTKQDIGLARLPTWMDIGLAPAGFIVYFLTAAVLVFVATKIIPGFDSTQVQETGFVQGQLSHYYEYLLAFVTLIVIAPLAEEVLFRGYLYGKLRKVVPVWVAMLITSVLFGAIHGQWNVAVDVFGLSMVACILREVSGSIWAGLLLHMLKNSVAFYVLFINPTFLHTIGG
jgi:membrane protease YdiL (CAAX protease family)